MPVVVIAAASLGRTGYESKKDLDADTELKAKLESIRLKAGPLMNLGDVAKNVVPKMCLVAPPQHGGAIMTRCFIPHVCHSTLGVLAAVTIGTACVLPGSVAAPLAKLPPGSRKVLSVEHPTGEFSVDLLLGGSAAQPKVERAALLRTARRLFEGSVLVPSAVWDGRSRLAAAAE
jgi:4-oxalomesaconate tautomerase